MEHQPITFESSLAILVPEQDKLTKDKAHLEGKNLEFDRELAGRNATLAEKETAVSQLIKDRGACLTSGDMSEVKKIDKKRAATMQEADLLKGEIADFETAKGHAAAKLKQVCGNLEYVSAEVDKLQFMQGQGQEHNALMQKVAATLPGLREAARVIGFDPLDMFSQLFVFTSTPENILASPLSPLTKKNVWEMK